MDVIRYKALNTFEALVYKDKKQIEFWLLRPKFLLGVVPYKDWNDAEYILKNVHSLGTMKKMFEEHKYLYGLMDVTG